MPQWWRNKRAGALHALLAEPGAAVALLDRHGHVMRANAVFAALAGPALVLAEPAAAQMRQAVAARQPWASESVLETAAGARPVAVSMAITGLRSPWAILRLSDLRPLAQLRAELAQAQRLQAVGQLAAGIAHDFNNLLTAILGAAEALAPHMPAGCAPDLAVIQASAGRGATLVRQLLAFGGQQTLQPRILNLNDAVRDAACLIGRVIGGGIRLEVVLDEPGRMVRIDPAQLDQLLLNLAVNARDAMPHGGTLTLATGWRLALAPEREDGTVIQPGRYATLEVRDTGAGIPPEMLGRIFEPFFTTKRGAGGTGLGLSSVHGIVRQSGGTLSVRSVVGEGTCFRITLPRHEAAVAGAPEPALPGLPALAPCEAHGRLLLVDDEAPIRGLAARALAKAGWDVLQAGSAEEALELDADGIALVVSDVMMPGMDGPSLVRALRQAHPGLRAILMSGYAGAAQRRALQAEEMVFLAKPFAMQALVACAGSAGGTKLVPPDPPSKIKGEASMKASPE